MAADTLSQRKFMRVPRRISIWLAVLQSTTTEANLMEIFLPWHKSLDDSRNTEKLVNNYFFNEDMEIFFGHGLMNICDCITKDVSWLQTQYSTYGSCLIEPEQFPFGWQFYRFRLTRAQEIA
jgi:hypothetical protein